MLFCPQHVGDAHGGVVHRNTEVVHWQSGRSKKYEVAKSVGVPTHLAADHVVDLNALSRRHAEAVGAGRAFRHLFCHLLGSSGAPPPSVLGWKLLRLLLFLHHSQLLVGTEARVGMAVIHELQRELHVDGAALRLAVRAVGTAHVRPLVPVQAHPLQVANHRVLGFLGGSCSVGVFDAKDQLATHIFGVQPIEECGACAANVQVPGGRWGEAHAHCPVALGDLDIDFLRPCRRARISGDTAHGGDGATGAAGAIDEVRAGGGRGGGDAATPGGAAEGHGASQRVGA
mmetsp:Transcript_3307/g.8224  ORF Transcript_3307/g.8224 Transcript_3307/m.8224 type:complete len:286 (+) Transcript_3307:1548-2405(+)